MKPSELREKMTAVILTDIVRMKQKCTEDASVGYMARLTILGNRLNGSNPWYPWNYMIVVDDTSLKNSHVWTHVEITCRNTTAATETIGSLTEQDITVLCAKAWDHDQEAQDDNYCKKESQYLRGGE